jgi:hypothetical protein
LKKRPGENDRQYIWRVGQAKDNGIIDYDWPELTDIFNSELQESPPMQESAFRKPYQSAKAYWNDVFSKMVQKGVSNSGSDVLYELEKEKVKIRDERNELSRLIREQARRESFIELVKRVITENTEPFEFNPAPCYESDCDMVVHITDLHGGLGADNWMNKFDADILHSRLNTYLSEILEIKATHNAERCYVVLGGDLISGIIHPNLRLENNENVIEQIKLVSRAIGKFVKRLCSEFAFVEVESVSGNHSRISPNKEQQLKGEELDALVPFYLEILLSETQNASVKESKYDESFTAFRVRGHLFYSVHGDKDTPSNVAANLTSMTAEKPKCIMMGHRHSSGHNTKHSVKTVESGCVCGEDSYAIDNRLSNIPEQSVIIVTEKRAVKCIYDVPLV